MKDIQEAVIDNFFTFDLFDNTKGNISKEYFKILKKLVDSQLLITSFDENKEVVFQNHFSNELDRRRKLYNEKNLINVMKKDFVSVKGDTFVFDGFKAPPFITENDKIIDLLAYSQLRAMFHYAEALGNEEYYTGVNTLNTKECFLLFPIRIEKNSDEIFYIDIYFTFFQHGYGILNASTRIKDEGVDQLSSSVWDIEIKSAFLPKFMFDIDVKEENKYEYKKIGGCKTILESINRYMDILQKKLNSKNTFDNKLKFKFNFDCMTILKMKNQPDNFENERIHLYPQIYKLLFAPIGHLALNNKTAKERVDKYSKQPDNNLKIFINSKRFIMIFGNDIYAEVSDSPEEIQKELLYSSYRSGMIFALEKLFLKNITMRKYLIRLSDPTLSLNKMYTILMNRDMELRYETNQLFYSFTSTREYIDFFVEKGIETSVLNAIEESVNRVKDLILLRRENRINKITIVTTILALVFTVLFSMAGIKETLETLGILDISIIISTYKIIVSLVFLTIILFYKDLLFVKSYRKIEKFFFPLYIKIKQYSRNRNKKKIEKN